MMPKHINRRERGKETSVKHRVISYGPAPKSYLGTAEPAADVPSPQDAACKAIDDGTSGLVLLELRSFG